MVSAASDHWEIRLGGQADQDRRTPDERTRGWPLGQAPARSTTATFPTGAAGLNLARCERCPTATVAIENATPWCPACEWGLDRYEPDRRPPEFGWQWVDRRTHALAYRLTSRQFTTLAQRALARPTMNLARAVVLTASVLLLAGVLALTLAGAALVAMWTPFSVVLGAAALGLAVALRPRFGRISPDVEVLSRQRAPALFQLVDEVAAAIDAPVPHVVAVCDKFDAYATSVGLRRRRVLCLGLPLWGALNPQERVALLGHELGHFVNGDVRRGLLTQPALTMLGSAADLIRPVESYGAGDAGGAAFLAHLVVRPVQWVLSRLLFTAHLLLVWVGLRDGQRAEYLADELAATVAGSSAATSLADVLLTADVVAMVVRREARAEHGPAHWRSAGDEVRASAADRLPLLRQLSVRDEVSLFASHPPAGLRSRMVAARPWRTPAVALTETRAEQIDAELAAAYERVRRHLAWSE